MSSSHRKSFTHLISLGSSPLSEAMAGPASMLRAKSSAREVKRLINSLIYHGILELDGSLAFSSTSSKSYWARGGWVKSHQIISMLTACLEKS